MAMKKKGIPPITILRKNKRLNHDLDDDDSLDQCPLSNFNADEETEG